MAVKTRAVLMIVHGFPRAGGAGVQRVLKFVKHLPERGRRSMGVTDMPETQAALDAALPGDTPNGAPMFLAGCRCLRSQS